MGHIETTRLVDLSEKGAIRRPEEIAHLRHCEDCQQLLGQFARQNETLRKTLEETAKPKDPSLKRVS